ncbi:MAG: GNAT family N-acetyltransferase [Bacteroidales bacterium]|nr:GNAT family N-acetyltransferase [Bacteroidales bacterium]
MELKTDRSTGNDIEIMDLTPDNIADYGVCGYKDANKHLELRRKIDWFNRYYPRGLRIKIILSKKGGYQGMLEYIPGKYAHRPVDAEKYMFVHCVFVGFKKEYKGKGYASSLIEACIKDARDAGTDGVAVVTRNGSFMAKKDIFLKKGFEVVDKAEPDFELLVLKFNREADNPKFKEMSPVQYSEGLTVMRSAQCPYSVKNVDAILETAKKMNIQARLVELADSDSVQLTPCAFGTFCIIHEGEVISYHPISNKRFENIMKSRLR